MSLNVENMTSAFGSQGLFQSTSFLDTVLSTIRMDLRIRLRYRANFIGQIVRSMLFILVFILFAGAYQFKGLTQLSSEQSTFLFFISGFIFIIFDVVALWVPLNTVYRDLYNGTLEYIYSCPSNRIAYYIGVVVSSGIVSFSLLLLPMMGFIVVTGGISVFVALELLLVVVLSLSVLTAFGTMFSLMAIMWKQVNSFPGILGVLFQFLSGFFFPIDLLPLPVRFIAYLLPYTWAIDIARVFVFGSAWSPILPLPYMWGILVGYGVTYWGAAVVLSRKVERFSKKQGLHLL